MAAFEALTMQILAKITPKKEERIKVDTLSRSLEQKIVDACQSEGVSAKVRVEGSVAKDTWLTENQDIDVFMRLPTSIPRKMLGEVGLRIAKKAAGDAKQIERFAEHPYLEIFVDSFRVDIVPCYDTKVGAWQSATDRTPYHTDYIRTHLGSELHGEVRLLKKFMQGIGVYGAEIKIGGFSGYLCELLVMHYGSFAGVVEAFAAYSRRIVIDLADFYKDRTRDMELLFSEQLVIVDPVDGGRNVAAAVQPQKLYEFVAAARAFLKAPNKTFFYPQPTHALPPTIIERHLAGHGTSYLYLSVGDLTAVPDVLWGQLYRTKRSLRTLLEINGFRVMRDTVWSNEKSLSVFVFELEQPVLPNVKRHLGPQLERHVDSERFLTKYSGDKQVVAGPYVENGRWVVMVTRKYTKATVLLQESLREGGKNAGVAELVAKAIKAGFEVLLDTEALKVYTENSDFAMFLTEFFSGKPLWL